MAKKQILPNDPNWELSRKYAHPKAAEILKEDFFWSGDGYSPFGFDDGSDALWFYAESHNRLGDPPNWRLFLENLRERFEFNLESWPLPDDLDRISITMASVAHKCIISVAFGSLLIHGFIDRKLRELAVEMIEREKSKIILSITAYPEEKIERMNLCLEKIHQFPIK